MRPLVLTLAVVLGCGCSVDSPSPRAGDPTPLPTVEPAPPMAPGGDVDAREERARQLIDACTVERRRAARSGGRFEGSALDEAVTCLEQALEQLPDDRLILRELASMQRDEVAWLVAYRRALDAHPGWSLLHSDVARHLVDAYTPVGLRTAADLEDPVTHAILSAESIQGLEELRAGLGLQAGDRVVDVGSGCGRYAVPLARWVGPEGRVYAQDILPVYTNLAEQVARQLELPWIEPVLGDATALGLPPGSVDLAFVNRVYAIASRGETGDAWLASLVESLAPDGRIAISGERADGREEAAQRLAPLGMVVQGRFRFAEEGEVLVLRRGQRESR